MKEIKYYGVHACQAIWQYRPQDVIRVYIHKDQLKAFAPLLKWCAKEKKAYHIVSDLDLEKVTESIHHEGVCVLAKQLRSLSEKEIVFADQMCLVYLDGVENPHNIGSILRSAAHFGVRYILGENIPPLSASACRIAKGGAEIVRFVSLSKPLETLKRLQVLGFQVVATSSHQGTSLYQFRCSPKTLFIIGSESKGVSRALSKPTHSLVRIPGSDLIESLNVSVATALCMGEYCRQVQL